MSIKKVYEIMWKIEKESSKNGKEAILKQYKDDEDFVGALKFLLNPYIVTGISTKKMNKEINKATPTIITGRDFGMKDIIDYILKNNSGRDDDILVIRHFLGMLATDELQEFVKKFVTKDLKLGISEKTVNKVYGKGTIPSFAVMLAESYEKKADKVTGEFYVTLKLDGNRDAVIKENNVVKFFTRKGQEVDGMTELAEHFKHLPDNTVFDGEILLVNKDNLPSDELFRATQKVIRKDGEKKDLEFHMFDIIPLDEFKAGKSKLKYKARRQILDELIKPIVEDSKLVHVLPVLYKGTDKSVIPTLLQEVEEKGYEGLMINNADGFYVTKRTNDLLKVKTMHTADLLVLDVEEAIDGQFKGLLGRVNVEYKDNTVGVGSGFTLEQRKLFIDNPDLIVGKVIEVQYFEESQDEKTGLPSLRFPVFKGIRDDKGVEDVNYG